jgi:hypothetical protein
MSARELERVLRARRREWSHDGFLYRGGGDLLLRHGRYYRGRRLPAGYRPLLGAPHTCFRNSAEAALADPELGYCEGLLSVGPQVAAHAWCVDQRGRVVELTFTTPQEPAKPWGYYGAVFAAELALEYMASIGAISAPLLDGATLDGAQLPRGLAAIPDDRDDWPILRRPYDPERVTFSELMRPEAARHRKPSSASSRATT